jgi:hypothetical protein
MYPTAKILLMGDLNARVGQRTDLIDDSVDHMYNMEWYQPEYFDIPKRSKDNIVNNFGRSLIDLCVTTGIYILNGRGWNDKNGEFTNITENGCSVVDYIIASANLFNIVSSFEIMNFCNIGANNHLPLHCALNVCGSVKEISEETHELDQITKIKWQNAFSDEFIENLELADTSELKNNFDKLCDSGNIADAVNLLIDVLQCAGKCMRQTANNNVKHQQNHQNKKQGQPEWWDLDCNKAKQYKYYKLNIYRKTNEIADLEIYKGARRTFKNMCKAKEQLHKRYLQNKILQCSNPNAIWKCVKEMQEPKTSNGEMVIKVDDWVNYFKNLLGALASHVDMNQSFKDEVNDFMSRHDNYCNDCSDNKMYELNRPFSIEELETCLANLPKGKASGYDGIPYEIITAGRGTIIPYLQHLFNVLLERGTFPEDWSKALICPVHKKGSKHDPNNFRGISLLSTVSKVFTKLLNIRLTKFAEANGLRQEEQAGFRKGYSTVDNIFVLQCLIQKYISKHKGRFYVLYVDFSKAFDSIPHSHLWYCLLSKGIHGNVIQVIRSMYANLKSCIKLPSGITEYFNCTVGTRQGCMLSPLLFSLYIGEFVDMLNNNNCAGIYVSENAPSIISLLYADDLANCGDSVGRLQAVINVLERFCYK